MSANSTPLDPQVVTNPPGLATIADRVNDFAGFREALLEPLNGEQALLGWHPAAGDLAVQILEWWAYLGDILTFYNERIANESYLRTAKFPASAAALVALIGYQPRPAIGAVGQVAALRNAAQPDEPLVLPAGLALASVATSDVPTQTFETSAAVTFAGASDVPVLLEPAWSTLSDPTGAGVLLAGTVSGLNVGDPLMIAPTPPWNAAAIAAGACPVSVVSVNVETDPNGATNTRVALAGLEAALAAEPAADFSILRSQQSTGLWTQTSDAAIVADSATEVDVHLLAAVRGVSPGDLVFIDGGANAATSTIALVTGVSEQFRSTPYPPPFPKDANGNIVTPPAIPISHTVLSVSIPSGSTFIAPPNGLTVAGVPASNAISAALSWVVTAVSDAGESLPCSPQSPPADTAGASTLNWEPVAGATGYNVYRAITVNGVMGAFALVGSLMGAQSTSYTDTGGETLTASPPSPGAVVVHFAYTPAGVPIATPATQLASLPAIVTPVVADPLPAPTGLTVTSSPVGGQLAGSQSWQVTALTPIGETEGSPQVTATIAGGSASLSWGAVEGATGYNVYRAAAGANGPQAAVLVAMIQDPGSTTYVDTGAPARSGSPPSVSTAGSVDLGARFAEGSIPVMLVDAGGAGLAAMAAAPGDGTLMINPAGPLDPFSLTAPLTLLLDVVEVSRGSTVAAEPLGTGDAGQAGQTFTLAQAPLTYLASGSTLQVAVDGIYWTEAPSFYGSEPQDQIFVVSQLSDGTSQVRFGDGLNGARLPTGSAVVATYRTGAGAASPPAGRLTTVLSPQPNLARIANPVAVGGGADAEQPASIRQNGPSSVLTFGRAISADDYEAVAAVAPGVARARAYSTWNAAQQRTSVILYVGDDANAQSAAQAALAGAEDPNRPVTVQLATTIALAVTGTLVVAANRNPEPVLAAATAALSDPLAGLFSPANMGIGQLLYKSAIEAALLVDGATAVHSLSVTTSPGHDIFGVQPGSVGWADPGQSSVFVLSGSPRLGWAVADG